VTAGKVTQNATVTVTATANDGSGVTAQMSVEVLPEWTKGNSGGGLNTSSLLSGSSSSNTSFWGKVADFFMSIWNSFANWLVRWLFNVEFAYAFGGADFGTDVKKKADIVGEMGYTSDYSFSPNLKESTIRNGLNREIIYFSAHGWSNGLQMDGKIYFVNRAGLDEMGLYEVNPIGINVEDFNLTKPKLIVFSACDTGSGTNNLCRVTFDSGAKCVIGWPVEVGAAIDQWTDLFYGELKKGKTIAQAISKADAFDYDAYWGSTHDNADMRSHVVYGNTSQTILR
jgi:hypothetical protein